MREYFFEISTACFEGLKDDELCLLNLKAEDTDFVRLNHAKVRQAGTVKQAYVEIILIKPQSKQQVSQVINLTYDKKLDIKRLIDAIADLRPIITQCPEDPYLVFNDSPSSTERVEQNKLSDSRHLIEEICAQAAGLDLVGIYCGGGIFRGFANSLGQRNWYETYSFNLDWSCYLRADKAVKTNYAGFQWQSHEFESKLKDVRLQLERLQKPVKSVQPGKYRAYLSPAAMDEITGLLKWGGFSEKALRTKQSCFTRMREKGLQLSKDFQLAENMTVGVTPGFDRTGFIRPDRTDLIAQGSLIQGMVSARTGEEYKITGNGAEQDEAPCSMEIDAGHINQADVLEQLGTGLLINNLWYLNYSDRNAARITGMTRFATFWVENGEIVAPLDVMRFDDSIYDIWGEKLVGLTKERSLCLSPMTYYQRETTSSLLPGAIVDDFTLTL